MPVGLQAKPVQAITTQQFDLRISDTAYKKRASLADSCKSKFCKASQSFQGN